jgi:hypothetical protein
MADKKIFISYRRADSQVMTDRIYAALVDAFGEQAVFRDIHSIPFGVDFRTHIQKAVAECDVMLVVIGDQWLDIKDLEGKRRLDQPTDWVRLEVQAGIERKDIPVVPLFLQGIKSIPEEILPDVLKNLAFRNGIPIRVDPDFKADINRLVQNLVENVGFERIKKTCSEHPKSLTKKVGERGVMIDGNVSGSTIITGDQSKVERDDEE